MLLALTKWLQSRWEDQEIKKTLEKTSLWVSLSVYFYFAVVHIVGSLFYQIIILLLTAHDFNTHFK